MRRVVSESFRRCEAMGLSPVSSVSPVACTASELALLREKNRELLDAARPFLRLLVASVRGTGFITTLTDARGVVIESLGDDAEILDLARLNNYVPGSSRGEEAVGTNSIGLAVIERRPIQLTGREHYNVRHHGWTCSSAPILAPELLGVVTLSGRSKNAHLHTLGMVTCAAEAIESTLRENRAAEERLRLGALLHSILNSVSEAIIALDTEGRVTHANASACRMLGEDVRGALGRDIASLLSLTPKEARALTGDEGAESVEIPRRGREHHAYLLTSSPIREGGRVIGRILVLSARAAVFRMVQDVSGYTAKFTFESITGTSPALLRQVKMARSAARADSRVLLAGESGTGKELFAHAIHGASPRSRGPFVAVNCAAIPRELLEAELFGYRGGAFTGARRGGQVGKIELAEGGTLFLDEIGHMPLDMQGKILRVLENSEVSRLGGGRPVRVNVRFIAATNRDLREAIAAREFREDLYYRLAGIEIALPPLRERLADLPEIAGRIVGRLRERLGFPGLTLSPQALSRLLAHPWPGNIRELENALETAAICAEGGVVGARDLPGRIADAPPPGARAPRRVLAASLRDVADAALREALLQCGGNVAEAARRLKVSRSTFYRRLHDLGARGGGPSGEANVA